MTLKNLWVLVIVAAPAMGQYDGPAIVSRGEAPAAMVMPAVKFRPYMELSGIYDTGLTSAALNSDGNLSSQPSWGSTLSWGVSGAHKWRRGQLGLDYHGNLSHYVQKTFYDSLNQALLLGLTEQVSQHTTLKVRLSAGNFSRNFALAGLQQTIPFDPASSYIPTTDYFDNRTSYVTTQVDYTIQKSARLSFNLGGDEFLTRRRSASLSGVTGTSARGDVQYRLTRRTTIGALYVFNHYHFTHALGGSDGHGAAATYAVRFSRSLELSGYGGFMRLESKGLQSANVDPLIAAILGVSSTSQIIHSVRYVPNFNARLSRSFHQGVAYVSAGHTVTPGNGLFLTSMSSIVMGGYNFTGLRWWTFGVQGGRTDSSATLATTGKYNTTSGSLLVARQLGHTANLVLGYSVRNHGSPDFDKYNRLVHEVSIGLGFSPGEVPLRLW